MTQGTESAGPGSDDDGTAGERMPSTGQTAQRLGISVRTVWRWEEARPAQADHPPARRPTEILGSGSRRPAPVEDGCRGVMRPLRPCRVREAARGGQPEATEKEGLVAAATAKGYEVVGCGAERASGPNEKHRDLQRRFRLAATVRLHVAATTNAGKGSALAPNVRQGAGTCAPPRRLPRDPGGGTEPCLEQSSLPALQPLGREVLARWARLPEPLAVRALWLDGSTPTSWRPCSGSGSGLSGTGPQRRTGLPKQVAAGRRAQSRGPTSG
jgi:hypothetical protein